MAKGYSFLSQGDPTLKGIIKHLNVIITEPNEDIAYLVVPVTTYYRNADGDPIQGQDKSCILNAGSHPFIKHESYVLYKKARQMSSVEIAAGILKGLLVKKEDMDPEIIHEMQEGAKVSPYLPEELTPFFRFFHEAY
jgi:hypothetical protein